MASPQAYIRAAKQAMEGLELLAQADETVTLLLKVPSVARRWKAGLLRVNVGQHIATEHARKICKYPQAKLL